MHVIVSQWYRKQVWTQEAEKDFFLHWARSKTEYHKAQYLKIQAFTLYDTHNKKYFDAILSLLHKYFNDFPNEQFFRGACLHLYGRVFYDRKMYDAAFDYYQKAAYQEINYPNVISGAWLDYAQIVVRLKRAGHYEEAEKIIQAHYGSLIFPIEIYRASAVLAMIYHERGDHENACRYKRSANEAALMEKSALRYHSDIGLVFKKDRFLEKAMKKIVL